LGYYNEISADEEINLYFEKILPSQYFSLEHNN